MKAEYEPLSIEQKLAYLVEECGEVQAAAGKSLRWGIHSFNPEPGASQERNREWLLREIADVEGAIARLRDDIEMQDYIDPPALDALPGDNDGDRTAMHERAVDAGLAEGKHLDE